MNKKSKGKMCLIKVSGYRTILDGRNNITKPDVNRILVEMGKHPKW